MPRLPCFSIALVVANLLGQCDAQTRVRTVKIVDSSGKPAANVGLATWWSANGKQWGPDGKAPKFDSDADPALAAFWDNEGDMRPWPNRGKAKDLGDGLYSIEVDATADTVYAMTDDRKQAAFAILLGQSSEVVAIELRPVVRVHGTVFCRERKQTPEWTYVAVFPGKEPLAVLHEFSSTLRFTGCGSMNGKFAFLLPEGVYDLDVYSERPDARMLKSYEREDAPENTPHGWGGVRIELDASQGEVDLGELNVIPRDTLDKLSAKRKNQSVDEEAR